MMDVAIFRAITDVLSTGDHVRRNGEGGGLEQRDAIGNVHIILFGDFKSVP